MSQGLREVLQSIADVMFPSDPGAVVQIDSIGYDGDTPLHVMAWQNNLEAVQVLIDAGADVNALGEMNETPLHIAVHLQNLRMVQALLDAGARTDMRCEFGDTPMERAAIKGGAIAGLFGGLGTPDKSPERTREG